MLVKICKDQFQLVDDFFEYSETRGKSRTSIPPKFLQHHADDGFDDGICTENQEADCYYDDDYVNKVGDDHKSNDSGNDDGDDVRSVGVEGDYYLGPRVHSYLKGQRLVPSSAIFYLT